MDWQSLEAGGQGLGEIGESLEIPSFRRSSIANGVSGSGFG